MQRLPALTPVSGPISSVPTARVLPFPPRALPQRPGDAAIIVSAPSSGLGATPSPLRLFETIFGRGLDGAEIYCAPEGAQPRRMRRVPLHRITALPHRFAFGLIGNLARVSHTKRRRHHSGDQT